MRSRNFHFVFLLPLAALVGCASSLEVKYDPTTPPAPLAASRQPRIVLANFQGGYPGLRAFGGGTIRVDGALEPVRDAFIAELKRLGFALVSAKASPDGLLSATIDEGSIECGGHVATCQGTLKLSLAFRTIDKTVLWKGEVAGTASVMCPMHGGYIGSAGSDAFNAALAQALGQMGPLFESEGVVNLLLSGAPALVSDAKHARAAGSESVAPLSDVDELPAPRSPRHAHAVVIGIEHYREQLPDAEFAARDAKLAAEYFKRVLGVPEQNIALLINDRATKSDFDKYLGHWLANRVEKDDEVYVYYSGHGAPNPKTGEAYLVPYDADPTYIESGGYSVKTMYDELAKLPAKRIVIAMDSCFSGGGGHSVIAKGSRPLVNVQAVDVPANLTVISASAGNQISNSFEAEGHGLFTYYFLKGLKAKGDDLRAVYDYLKPEVTRVARQEYNSDQEPQWRGANP